MKELVPNRLWIREMPLRLFGLEWGTRMSVVRLSGEGGALWLHSPVALDQRLREELEGLGQVRFVVCPNLGHHMFAGEYFAAYPDAGFYAAPGLPEKRTDLPFDGVLGDEPEPGWARDLEQAVFRGNQMVREVVFCHQESHTLIVADLVQSADSGSPMLTRLVKRLMGTYERPGLPLPSDSGFATRRPLGPPWSASYRVSSTGSYSVTGRSWRVAARLSSAKPTRSSRENAAPPGERTA